MLKKIKRAKKEVSFNPVTPTPLPSAVVLMAFYLWCVARRGYESI